MHNSIHAPKKTIVIADDQKDMRRLVQMTLEYGEYLLLEAESAVVAEELIKAKKVNLLILDIFMPGSYNGLELCRHLKSDVSTASISIILLSGDGSEHIRAAALESGSDAFLPKPFSPLRLIEVVERLIRPVSGLATL